MLSLLIIPVLAGVTVSTVQASTVDDASGSGVLLAQTTEETPTQTEQSEEPAAETPAAPAESAEPAAESPEAAAEPAEVAEAASDINWPLILGGILAVVLIIALISALARRPRE